VANEIKKIQVLFINGSQAMKIGCAPVSANDRLFMPKGTALRLYVNPGRTLGDWPEGNFNYFPG
jgi:hypothetical protein